MNDNERWKTSGDSLAFLLRRLAVVSLDASIEMVKATTALTGQSALLMRFDEIAFESEFDGIWACASLLHVAGRDLDAVLVRLTRALRPNGIIYMSFKHGESERLTHGRFFNDMTDGQLRSLLAEHPGLELLRLWISDDVRNDQRSQKWVNAIARRIQ